MVYLEAGDFWGRVRTLCSVNGISLAEMSRRAGISYGNLTRQISQGQEPVKYRQIKVIADVLGSTPEYLVDGERANENRPAPELMELLGDFALLEKEQQELIRAQIIQYKKDNERRYELEERLEPSQD